MTIRWRHQLNVTRRSTVAANTQDVGHQERRETTGSCRRDFRYVFTSCVVVGRSLKSGVAAYKMMGATALSFDRSNSTFVCCQLGLKFSYHFKIIYYKNKEKNYSLMPEPFLFSIVNPYDETRTKNLEITTITNISMPLRIVKWCKFWYYAVNGGIKCLHILPFI